MKRALLVLVSIVSVVAAGPINQAPASVKVVALCNPDSATKRPSKMVFACGDAGLQAAGLSWRSWGDKRVKGFGTIIYKLCDPNCLSGGVARKSGKVTLYRKGRCSRHHYRYSRARVKAFGGITVKQRIIACP